ncbi:MAG: sorbosone dehydrogenase family protein [Phycisphaerales bacterium]|nr:sorbosone dehydrogenase family protein [Phycisphaerales bacterium]
MRTLCVSVLIAQAAFAQPAAAPDASVGASPTEFGPKPTLPAPDENASKTKFAKMRPWADGQSPKAPAGFTVSRLAGGLEYPRWLYVLPNGDTLCAEARPGAEKPKPGEEDSGASHVGKRVSRVLLFKGDGDDQKPVVLLDESKGADMPFGMAFNGQHLYIANSAEVRRYEFQPGQTEIKGKGEKILDLPGKGYHGHWTRNLLLSPDAKTLFVSVGSASNVAEDGIGKEKRRANILAVDLDGKNERIYARGLRNPVGMAFEPKTGQLWTAVNERDEIGDQIVPDYLAAVREGEDYGWPYTYWGGKPDPRHKDHKPDGPIATPAYALGAHTASLGLAFSTGDSLPEKYRSGAFIGQHGSWNRSELVGYKVVFVPFADGRPSGPPVDFLTGFVADEASGATFGRPCGVAFAADGSILVADDAGGVIWRVRAEATGDAAQPMGQ